MTHAQLFIINTFTSHSWGLAGNLHHLEDYLPLNAKLKHSLNIINYSVMKPRNLMVKCRYLEISLRPLNARGQVFYRRISALWHRLFFFFFPLG